jgi:hypothetical protein
VGACGASQHARTYRQAKGTNRSADRTRRGPGCCEIERQLPDEQRSQRKEERLKAEGNHQREACTIRLGPAAGRSASQEYDDASEASQRDADLCKAKE